MFADVGRAATIGQPSGGRTEAAAFEQALVDELARDRSFHPVDGRIGSLQEARFDQAIEVRSGSETIDPRKTASGGLVEETVTAGAYRRVGFDADAGATRKVDGDDHAAMGPQPGEQTAFWLGDRFAEAPLPSTGVPDFQDKPSVNAGIS
ncbi:MAG: hypothetical protein OEU92_33520, partial [Alphaproteobacteria bacterium]|nr:hypothetical protein [Alphaproteobacteria bacterium]